jgi:uncharacterized protein
MFHQPGTVNGDMTDSGHVVKRSILSGQGRNCPSCPTHGTVYSTCQGKEEMSNQSTAIIEQILRDCHIIAVVGLSSNPVRPSYRVASYMKTQGYRVIPVNPNETNVLGEPAYPSLAAVPGTVDLVNIFRKSEEVLPIVEDAITHGAKAIWMQEGVSNQSAAVHAIASGMLVVMDRCWLKEHHARSHRG